MADPLAFSQLPPQMQHLQQQVESIPPVPQIRVAPVQRGKATNTPRPQMRNPPEPFVHDFQPKTPDRGDGGGGGGGDRAGGGGAAAGGLMEVPFMDPHFQPGPSMQADPMQFHPQAFPPGSFTPGHTFIDPNMQGMIGDPAMLQQQQMNLHQQLFQQQKMFNPLQKMMTPTHGLGIPNRGAFAGPPGGAGRGRLGGRQPSAAGLGPSWMQDPIHNLMEEEKERKREMKLLKNREAAREGREKKRRYQLVLEARVCLLEKQNRALIEELKALKYLFCKPNQPLAGQQHVQQAPPQPQYDQNQFEG